MIRIMYRNDASRHLQKGPAENVLVQLVGVQPIGGRQTAFHAREELAGGAVRIDAAEGIKVEEEKRAASEREGDVDEMTRRSAADQHEKAADGGDGADQRELIGREPAVVR